VWNLWAEEGDVDLSGNFGYYVKINLVINTGYLTLSRQYIFGSTKIAEHDVKFWFGSLLEFLRWKYSTYRRENIRKTSEDFVLSKPTSKLLRKRVGVFPPCRRTRLPPGLVVWIYYVASLTTVVTVALGLPFYRGKGLSCVQCLRLCYI